MKRKILAILPVSIGGRLTTSSIIDGFIENDFKVVVFDELKDKNIIFYLKENYDYIVGYDFSPIKIKIDNNLKIPCLAYFSDNIYSKTAGAEYEKYYPFLKKTDIFAFCWDRILSIQENMFYQPHFVNTKIYRNYLKPKIDILFMGRFDTDLRLNTFLKLNKILPGLKFNWYAIKKHYVDALSRCKDKIDIKILKNTYKGFIDNEKDMAKIINQAKIVYNINAQGVTSLNYRTIQTLACERLIISDKREELDLFKNIIPTYSNIEDLAQKITFYLENNEKYCEITKKSREIVELNHDSKICVKNMLNKIEKN